MAQPLHHPNDPHLDLLLHSFDAPLDADQRRILDAALAQRADLRVQQQQHLALRQALAGLRTAPDADFTGRVMARIAEQRHVLAPVIRLWPLVAVAASVVLVLGLAFIYYHTCSLDADALVGVDTLDLDDALAFGE